MYETSLRVKVDSTGARQGADQVNRALNSMTTEAGRSERALKGMGNAFDAVKGAVFSLRGAVAALGLAALVRELVQAQLAMDRITNTLTAVTGSTEAAGAEFAFVSRTAKALGLDLQAAASEYARLAAASKGTRLEGQATRDIFEAMSKASTVLGLSGEQAGRAFSAFQQIISKGKVSMEEIRGQLGDVLPGAVLIFADALGVTAAEFQKMVEKGLDAGTVLPKVAAELEKRFGPGAAAAAKSLNAELNRTKTAIFDLQTEFNRAGFGDVMLSAARGVNETLGSERLRDNVKEWARALRDTFQWMADNREWLIPLATALSGAATGRWFGKAGAVAGGAAGLIAGGEAMRDPVAEARRAMELGERRLTEATKELGPDHATVKRYADALVVLRREFDSAQIAAVGFADDFPPLVMATNQAGAATEVLSDKASDLIAKLKMEADSIGKTTLEREIAKTLLQAETDAKTAAGKEIAALVTLIYREGLAIKGRNDALESAAKLAQDEEDMRRKASERAQDILRTRDRMNRDLEEEVALAQKRLSIAGLDERSQRIEIALMQEEQRWRKAGLPLLKDEIEAKRASIAQVIDAEIAGDKAREAAQQYASAWCDADDDAKAAVALMVAAILLEAFSDRRSDQVLNLALDPITIPAADDRNIPPIGGMFVDERIAA